MLETAALLLQPLNGGVRGQGAVNEGVEQVQGGVFADETVLPLQLSGKASFRQYHRLIIRQTSGMVKYFVGHC